MTARGRPRAELEAEREALLGEAEQLRASVDTMHPRMAARLAREIADRLDALALEYEQSLEDPP